MIELGLVYSPVRFNSLLRKKKLFEPFFTGNRELIGGELSNKQIQISIVIVVDESGGNV